MTCLGCFNSGAGIDCCRVVASGPFGAPVDDPRSRATRSYLGLGLITLGLGWATMLPAGWHDAQLQDALDASEPIDSVVLVRYTGIVSSLTTAVQARGRG